MIVHYQLVHPNAKVPTRATEGSAGWDLYLPEPIRIGPPAQAVDLGFRIEIPEGWEAAIRPRSSLYKYGIFIPNSPATIDSDYRGNIHVVLQGHRYTPFDANERIAQMLFSPVPCVHWCEADDLTPSIRGDGGFGSTGK